MNHYCIALLMTVTDISGILHADFVVSSLDNAGNMSQLLTSLQGCRCIQTASGNRKNIWHFAFLHSSSLSRRFSPYWWPIHPSANSSQVSQKKKKGRQSASLSSSIHPMPKQPAKWKRIAARWTGGHWNKWKGAGPAGRTSPTTTGWRAPAIS